MKKGGIDGGLLTPEDAQTAAYEATPAAGQRIQSWDASSSPGGGEGKKGRENSPSEAWAVGIREADGGRGLGCHSYGERGCEQGQSVPRATLSLPGRHRE